MGKRIRVFDKKNTENVKRICDEFKKDYKVIGDDELIIEGENLEGLLDKINKNNLAEIIEL